MAKDFLEKKGDQEMREGDYWSIWLGSKNRTLKILGKEEVIQCTSEAFYRAGISSGMVFVREHLQKKPIGLVKAFSKEILLKEGTKE